MIARIFLVLSSIPAVAIWPTMWIALLSQLRTVYAKVEHISVETITRDHAALHTEWSKLEKRTTGLQNSTYTGLGSDPINLRGNDIKCDDFFAATAENMEASKFGQAYVEWLNHVGQNATIWTDQSHELDVFLRNVIGWQDSVTCGVGDNGCLRLPKCDDIYGRVQDREHARQIFFVVTSAENLNRISAAVHVGLSLGLKASSPAKYTLRMLAGSKLIDQQAQSLKAEVNVLAMAETIANTFAWKYDESITAKCAMYSGMVQALITAIMLSFLAAAPMVAPAIGPVGIAAEELARSLKKSPNMVARAGRQAMRAEAAKVASKAPWTAGKVLRTAGGTLRRGWGHFGARATTKTTVAANAFIPVPNMAAGLSITNNICKHFPNPAKQSEANWRRQLQNSMKEAGMTYRQEIEQGLSELNLYNTSAGWIDLNGMKSLDDETGSAGNVTGRFSSIFAESIYSGSYVYLDENERQAYINEPWILESAMTAHFQNAMISLLLKNNICYIQCTSKDNIDNEVPPCIPEKAYRFEPEEGVICQPQCWQNWATHHKNIEMFGMEELMNNAEKWKVDGMTFLNSSYHHWKGTRYRKDADSMFPELGDILSGQQGNSSTGAAVPIAYTPQPLKDLTKKTRDKTLPCVVGNDLGNETQAFLDAINIKSWVGLDGWKGLTMACLNSFAKDHVNPIQTFSMVCNSGFHWPNRGNATLGIPEDKHHELRNGSDPLCQPYMDEVKKKMDTGMNFKQVTCEMTLANISWTIYDQQKSQAFRPHSKSNPSYWSYQKAAWWYRWRQQCPHTETEIPDCPMHHSWNPAECYTADKVNYLRPGKSRKCRKVKKEKPPPPGTISPRSANSFKKKVASAAWRFYNGK